MSVARDEELALMFTEARTHSAWRDTPVSDDLLRRLYELARLPPTGSNAQPLRVVFVKSPAAKERLRPALMPLNVQKAMTAPVTAVLAYDVSWYEKLPQLMPSRPETRGRVASLPPETRERLGFQSSTLQVGYLIMAARALGLDCGPMGGFDAEKVDSAFFPDGAWRTTLLLNLGHGDPTGLYPRSPRLAFDQACKIA